METNTQDELKAHLIGFRRGVSRPGISACPIAQAVGRGWKPSNILTDQEQVEEVRSRSRSFKPERSDERSSRSVIRRTRRLAVPFRKTRARL